MFFVRNLKFLMGASFPSWIGVAIVITAIYTSIVLLTSVQMFACKMKSGLPGTFMETVWWQSKVWYSWAALTPLILWTSRRHSILNDTRYRTILVHISSSISLAIIYLITYSIFILLYKYESLQFPVFRDNFFDVILESFHIPLILYWATVGLYTTGMKYKKNKGQKAQETRPMLRKPADQSRFVIKELDGIHLVKEEEIDWIEAADYYAKIHVGTKTFLIRESLANLEKKLNLRLFQAQFGRCHGDL